MHMIDQSQSYVQYTSLKAPLDEVYQAIKNRDLLHPPASMTKLLSKRDMSRFCEFHNTHSHTTAHCRDLKNQVEDLVRNRYLDEFVDEAFPRPDSSYEVD